MADTIVDKILENAQGPKRAKGDSGEVEQFDLKDQIEADRYLKSAAATAGKKLRLRFGRFIPHGAD